MSIQKIELDNEIDQFSFGVYFAKSFDRMFDSPQQIISGWTQIPAETIELTYQMVYGVQGVPNATIRFYNGEVVSNNGIGRRNSGEIPIGTKVIDLLQPFIQQNIFMVAVINLNPNQRQINYPGASSLEQDAVEPVLMFRGFAESLSNSRLSLRSDDYIVNAKHWSSLLHSVMLSGPFMNSTVSNQYLSAAAIQSIYAQAYATDTETGSVSTTSVAQTMEADGLDYPAWNKMVNSKGICYAFFDFLRKFAALDMHRVKFTADNWLGGDSPNVRDIENMQNQGIQIVLKVFDHILQQLDASKTHCKVTVDAGGVSDHIVDTMFTNIQLTLEGSKLSNSYYDFIVAMTGYFELALVATADSLSMEPIVVDVKDTKLQMINVDNLTVSRGYSRPIVASALVVNGIASDSEVEASGDQSTLTNIGPVYYRNTAQSEFGSIMFFPAPGWIESIGQFSRVVYDSSNETTWTAPHGEKVDGKPGKPSMSEDGIALLLHRLTAEKHNSIVYSRYNVSAGIPFTLVCSPGQPIMLDFRNGAGYTIHGSVIGCQYTFMRKSAVASCQLTIAFPKINSNTGQTSYALWKPLGGVNLYMGRKLFK